MKSGDQPVPMSDPRQCGQIALTSSLYGELRKLAASRMAGQNAPQTLQATALLHEAWMRIGCPEQKNWNDRKHYYAAVAEAMRHILVDRARRRRAIRHGGELRRVTMRDWNWENLEDAKVRNQDKAVLVLNDALEQLTEEDGETAQLVKLYYFAGLSIDEVARETGLSRRTTERRLAFARWWLSREIRNATAA